MAAFYRTVSVVSIDFRRFLFLHPSSASTSASAVALLAHRRYLRGSKTTLARPAAMLAADKLLLRSSIKQRTIECARTLPPGASERAHGTLRKPHA